MSDRKIIYLDDAIDALEEPCKVSNTWTDEYAVGERAQWEKDVKALNSLPSAQPEIVRCKDCKHRPTLDEDGELDFPPTYRCPCQCDDYYYSWMPKDDWFCGNAERRINNGT